MEITTMLSDNNDVPKAQDVASARQSIPASNAPKPSKRKAVPAAVKPEVRSKRALSATKHRLAELEAYTLALSAFFAQGELTWQKEGILGDLRQMLRISEEHHQREMQRIWANPALCATARANSGGKDNSDRGKFMYDILPDPKSPSDTESEVEDAATVVKKKKKKKKSATSTSSTAASSKPPPPVAESLPSAPVSEKPTKVLILKKAPKKPAPAEPVLAPPAPPLEPKQTPQDEMTRLQLEKQKLQDELARLAAEEDEEEEEDGVDEASDTETRMDTTAGKGPGGVGISPAESGDE